MPQRVVFVEMRLSHYRFRFLEALAADLAADGVELRAACHVHAPAGTFAERRGVPVTTARLGLRRVQLGGAELLWLDGLLRATRDADLVIAPQQPKQVAVQALLARQWVGGPPVALWGHGHTPRSITSDQPLARAAKERFSRAAHWWFAYTDGAAEQVAGFGFPRERITSVVNSTDTAGLRRALDRVTDTDLAAFDRDHDLGGRPLFLFLGTFRRNKQIPFLIEAFREVAADTDAVLGFAGDGELADLVARTAKETPSVRDLGLLRSEAMATALRRAHAVVVPAWVGLVAVDALAAGVPFVTRARAAHPPEIEYLEHDRNALVVDDHDDPGEFAAAMCSLLDRPELHRRLAEGALASSSRYSAERMAERFAVGVRAALAG